MKKLLTLTKRCHFILLSCVLSLSCSTQHEKNEAALRAGNFNVLFPPVSFNEWPMAPAIINNSVWIPDRQCKRHLQFGTIESRHETFKALFKMYFPTAYLTESRSRIRSLSELIEEKMWRRVREDREWSTFLTLLSNVKLFQAKMARPLVFEYLRHEKGETEDDENLAWEELEKRIESFLSGIQERKTLPGLFNMYPGARRQFLDAIQLSRIPFFSQMAFKVRGSINRILYEEHFGPMLKNRNTPLEQDFFLNEKEQDLEEPNGDQRQSSALALRSKCHLTYNPKTQTLDGQIDVVVVGAGSTGSYLAYLLWRAGYKVLLVDKGSMPTQFSPMGKRYALWNTDFVNSKNFFEEGKLLFLRPELIGGGDTLGPQVSWPITNGEVIHFIHSKREAGIFPPSFYDEDKREEINNSVATVVGARLFPDEELYGREKSFKEAALVTGLDIQALRSGASDRRTQFSSPYNKSNMAMDTYLKEALSDYKNPLCLLPRISVQKVIVQNIGNKFVTKGPVMRALSWPHDTQNEIYPKVRLNIPDNLLFKVLPKFIILSAGVPGSLQILTKSGIKHPALGRGIAFNYSQLLFGIYSSPLQNMSAPFTRLALGPKRDGDMAPYEFMIHEIPFEGPHLAQAAGPFLEWAYPLFRHADQVRTLLVSLMNEDSGGNSYDFVQNRVRNNNLDGNFNKLKQGLFAAAKIHFELGARAVMLPQLSRMSATKNNDPERSFQFDSLVKFDIYLTQLKQVPYVNPMLVYASNGGALRGSNSEIGPLDILGRPQGFENLYVMDASVLPPGIGPYHSFFLKALAHTLIQSITGLP